MFKTVASCDWLITNGSSCSLALLLITSARDGSRGQPASDNDVVFVEAAVLGMLVVWVLRRLLIIRVTSSASAGFTVQITATTTQMGLDKLTSPFWSLRSGDTVVDTRPSSSFAKMCPCVTELSCPLSPASEIASLAALISNARSTADTAPDENSSNSASDAL